MIIINIIEIHGDTDIKLVINHAIEQVVIAINHIGNNALNCELPDRLPILPL